MVANILDVYELRWSVRGYYIYRELWEAACAEVLTCVRETENVSDIYAVADVTNDETVGHVPRDRQRVAIFRTFKFRRAVLHYKIYEINNPTNLAAIRYAFSSNTCI